MSASELGATSVTVLESLNQHRLLLTGQVHELHNATSVPAMGSGTARLAG
jgi:hypothetical protein